MHGELLVLILVHVLLLILDAGLALEAAAKGRFRMQAA